MTRAEFEQHLHRDGYHEVVEKDLQPSPSNGEHGHHFDVRGLVIAGEFTVTIGDTATTYGAGEIFDVANDVLHSEMIGPTGARVVIGRRY